MPVMEVKILPVGTKTASVSTYVANAVKVLKEKNIKHQVTSMGTIMGADSVEQLFDVAALMHKSTLEKLDRVVTFIELDERKDKKLTMEGKIESIQKKME